MVTLFEIVHNYFQLVRDISAYLRKKKVVYHYYWKSLTFLIFLSVSTLSNLLFCSIKLARVSLLLLFEAVYCLPPSPIKIQSWDNGGGGLAHSKINLFRAITGSPTINASYYYRKNACAFSILFWVRDGLREGTFPFKSMFKNYVHIMSTDSYPYISF